MRVLLAFVMGSTVCALMCEHALGAEAGQKPCPVTLGTMQLTGITADQTQRRYNVGVRRPSPLGDSQLELALLDDHAATVAHVTTAVLSPKSASVDLEIWITKPIVKVRIERITHPDGSDPLPCGSQAELADADHASSTITIFARDRELPRGAAVFAIFAIDADFLHRAQPLYPEFVRNRGITGLVVVTVTVGPSGAADRVVLYRTSDDRSLDDAALSAARNSRYSAPSRNGVSSSADYLIDYVFIFDGMPMRDPCGASIGGFFYAGKVSGLAASLFDIDVSSSDGNVTSANLGFYNGQSRHGVTLSLPQIVFEKPGSDALARVPVNERAEVLWFGPEINYADLQSVVGRDGNVRTCHDAAVHALGTDGRPLDANVAPDSDLSAPYAYLVLPARYERRVFPTYPATEAAAAHGGCASVLIHVKSMGAADQVVVVRSSGHDALDGAAIEAATASLYRETSRNGEAQSDYYNSQYCFSPQAAPVP